MFSEGMILWLQQFSTPWLDKLFIVLSSLGSEYMYLGLLTFIYWGISRRTGRSLFMAFLVSVWLNSVLKDVLGWPRPSGDLVRVLSYEWSSGFPSGHAQLAATVWGYIAMRWPKRPIVVVSTLLIFVIALSRLYLGMHYLGQVLVGLGLGLAIAAMMVASERRMRCAPQPRAWRAALTVLAAYVLAIPVQSDDGFRIAGVWMGLMLTDAVPRRISGDSLPESYSVEGTAYSWPIRLVCTLVGWLGLGAGYILVKRLAAPGVAMLFAYAALAAWVTSGAPALLRLLKLGAPNRSSVDESATARYPIPASVPIPESVAVTPEVSPVFAVGLFILLSVGLTLPSVEFSGWLGGGSPAAMEASSMVATLPALQTEESFLVFGHRGAQGLAPANTLAAFGKGLQVGASVLECDVWRTLDGHLVVIHDGRIDNVTNGTGAVSALTLSELRQFDAGYHFSDDNENFPYRGQNIRIPTLEMVLRAYPTARFNIDMKDHSSDMPHALLAVLSATQAENRVIISSFDGPTIRRFRQLAPGIPTALASDEVRRFIVMARLGVGIFYQPPAKYMQIPEREGMVQLATPATFRLAHRLGMDVHIWTINDQTTMRRLIAAGADGIITDYPDRLVNVLTGKAEIVH